MRFSGLFAFACVIVTIGCGDDGGARPDAPVTSGDDAAPDAPDQMVACGDAGAAEMTCSGACVDTSSDSEHCGDCTTTCTGTLTACAAGTCVAPFTTSWVKHFGGADFGYGVTGIAVDGAGNVYFTGYYETSIDLGNGALDSAGALDIVVASYAPSGTLRWAKRYGGTGSDQGAGLTVAAGKVYVTGNFADTTNFGGGARTSAGNGDVFLLVLSATDGAYVTDRAYGGVGDDTGLSVAVDPSGNIAFGGYFTQGTMDIGGTSLTTAAFAGFVASVDPAFAHRWSRRVGGNANSDISSMQHLAVDAAGNVAIAVEFEGTDDFGDGSISSAGNFDAVVASYTSTGAFRWKRKFGSTQSDTAETVAFDATGNVLVGGGFHGTIDFGKGNLTASGVIDGWVALFEGPTGATRWARKIGSAQSSATNDVAFDPNGNAIFSANIEGTTDIGTGSLSLYDQYDILIAGLDKTTGTTQFARTYGGFDFEAANTIAITNGGNLAVGGYFRDSVDFGLSSGDVTGGTKDNGYVMMIAR